MATPTTGPNSYQSIPVYNAVIPKEGPKALPVTCNFATVSTYDIDLTLAQTQQRITVVQALFCDNSSNGSEVSITASGLAQTVTVPPYSQAYLPFLCPKPTIITAVSVSSTATVLIVFLNVPTPAQVWDVLGGGLAPSGGTATTFTPVAGLLNGTGVVTPFNVDSNGYLRVDTTNIINGNIATTTAIANGSGDVEIVTPVGPLANIIDITILNTDTTHSVVIGFNSTSGGTVGFTLPPGKDLKVEAVAGLSSMVGYCAVSGATVIVSTCYSYTVV